MLERKCERIELINSFGAEELSLYDLSKTGICCYHSEPKLKNTIVEIRINNLKLPAKIIYCQKRRNGYRLGLQFLKILPNIQEKLNTIVDNYSRGIPVTCNIIEDLKGNKKILAKI